MDNSTIVLLINDNARAVKAKWEDGGKEETFKTFDPSIKVDDLIVVESSTRHCMTVCKVTEVDVDVNFDTASGIRWVVQKIDTKSFENILDQEKEAISAVQSAERQRKKKALRASLFANHEEQINSLQLADMSGEGEVTE